MAEQYTIPQTTRSPHGHISFTRIPNEPTSVKIARQNSGTLLTSKGGISLPIEICLRVIEEVVGKDPEVGSWALMGLSKSFYSLLHTYQHSIVKRVSTIEGTHNLYPAILLPSWPRNARIFALSYPWLSEVRCRIHTIESLINHEVTNMMPGNRITLDLPIPNASEPELSRRIGRFKRDALHILFCMVDTTSAIYPSDIHAIRANQCAYLESLTTRQLAILGVFVRVLGLGYFRQTKSTHPNKTSDSIRDRWIVFEDRILRYGPFFAYAAVVQTGGAIREWSDEAMAQTLSDMEAFETGRGVGYASLQSELWKLFCVRNECDMFNSWEEAKSAVEIEMMGYEV